MHIYKKIKDGYQSGITITQARTNVLRVLRYYFGGSITTTIKRNNDNDNSGILYKTNVRNQYNLIIRSNEYNILIDYIKYNMVIKNTQIECLNKFSKLVNLKNKTEKQELFELCSYCNKTHISTNIKLDNVNIQYIAGLFDSEGCIYINNKNYSKYYISITQKNNQIVLDRIVEILGFGKIDIEHKYKIYNKKDCLKFLLLVKPYLIVKYNQACAFEIILNTSDINIKREQYEITNKEKHEIEYFTNLNNNSFEKDRFYEKEKILKKYKNVLTEIKIKKMYKEKSENMKAENNHNYGKKFTDETKRKMSISIRNSKLGISDEKIIEVRNLIENGYKNIEIQKLLNLPRHTITRIKNKKIICRHENKT